MNPAAAPHSQSLPVAGRVTEFRRQAALPPMNWQHLKPGYICERIIGFSLPVCGEVAVISYEGVHIIPLTRPDVVAHYPELAEGGDAYDSERQQLEFGGRGFPILGLHGGTPRLRSARGEQITFGDGDVFTLRDASGHEVFTHTYDDLSGDWRVVTFTPDDEHILFGLPYELQIFQRDRAA